MMKHILTLITILICTLGFAQLPQIVDDNNQIIQHNGFTLSYNEKHEQANWVYYMLKPLDIVGLQKSSRNNFREDTLVKTGSASLSDYRGSGYDRGHLKPASDEAYDQEQMDETFVLSNVSPMDAAFNRGIWTRLENHVRAVTLTSDSVAVITGGVLTDGLPTIGKNQVSVPEYFFKIIFVYFEDRVIVQAFIVPHKKSNDSVSTFLVSLKVFVEFTHIYI